MSEFDELVREVFPFHINVRHGFPADHFPDFAERVIREFRPIAGSINANRELRDAAQGSWGSDRGLAILILEMAGLLAVDREPDHYIFAHQTSLALAGSRDYFLANSPTFSAETLWRFFDVPGGGQISLRNLDNYTGHGWGDTFVEWVESGRVDRARVLESCIAALGRDFGAYTAGWFSDVFTRLRPSVDEIAALEPELRRLLATTVGPTLTLALRCLKQLHAAGRLDVEAFVMSAGPAMRGPKGSALEVLAISRQSQAPHLYAAGLEHPHRDVQAAAAKWLIARGNRSVVEAARSTMAPSVLESLGMAIVDPTPSIAASRGESPKKRTWLPIEPWPADELIERLAVLLEDATDAVEVENGLRALAATKDFSSLAPLMKTARRAVDRAESWPEEGVSLRGLFGTIVLAADGVDHGRRVSKLVDLFPPLVFSRFEEVRERVLTRGAPHTLLATPADSAGWVRAGDVIPLLASEVWKADLTAALLRFSPDGRAEALAALPIGLPEEIAAVIRFALGEPAGRIRTPQWWVAAAQSRDHRAEHPALLAARLGRAGQGRPVTAHLVTSYELNNPAQRAEYRDIPVGSWHATLETGEHRSLIRRHPVDQPTVIDPARKRAWHWDRPFARVNDDVTSFLGLMWPHSTELAAHAGIRALITRSHENQTAYGAAPTLSAIQNSPGEVGELARSAIVLGLSAKDVPMRRQAAEVFVDVVPSRTSVDAFARTLASIYGLCTFSRLADSFLDAAGISDASARTVTDLLIAVLPQLSRESTGLAALLALLDDELLRAGRPTDDAALRDWLSGFSGSSKAAKSAKSMLARYQEPGL